MPSKEKTATLGLCQWAGNEYPKREDFVGDNAAIDSAIKALQDKDAALSQDVADQLTQAGQTVQAMLDQAFDFDCMTQYPAGAVYAASESGGVWTETVTVSGATYATRTSTPTSTGWTVRTVCSAHGIDKTVTYTEASGAWSGTIGG